MMKYILVDKSEVHLQFPDQMQTVLTTCKDILKTEAMFQHLPCIKILMFNTLIKENYINLPEWILSTQQYL